MFLLEVKQVDGLSADRLEEIAEPGLLVCLLFVLSNKCF